MTNGHGAEGTLGPTKPGSAGGTIPPTGFSTKKLTRSTTPLRATPRTWADTSVSTLGSLDSWWKAPRKGGLSLLNQRHAGRRSPQPRIGAKTTHELLSDGTLPARGPVRLASLVLHFTEGEGVQTGEGRYESSMRDSAFQLPRMGEIGSSASGYLQRKLPVCRPPSSGSRSPHHRIIYHTGV